MQLVSYQPGNEYYIAVYGYDEDEIGEFLIAAYEFSKTDLLTYRNHKWHGVTQEVFTDGTLTNTVDITNQDLKLQEDNTYRTYLDGSSDANGTWSLSDDEQIITLFDGNEFEIEELTALRFVFTLHTTLGGNPTDVKYTYQK